MKIIADYHTHTSYSHGQGTIEENIIAAREKGLQKIAIADHGPRSYSIRKFGVKDAETLLEIKKEIEKYNKYYSDIKVLAAVEANIVSMDGELDVPKEILEQLDKVLVGFHVFIKPVDFKSVWGIIVNNTIINKLKLNSAEIRKINTELMIKVLNNYQVDLITHPGYQVNIDTKLLARAAVQNNVALEINSKHGFLTEDFVKVAAQEGATFSLGSDAHEPGQVGEVGPALEIVNNLGISATQIINAEE